MKKVTLKDIANKLNVTVGTVSHVLNGIDDISVETKMKVLKTAEKMGYVSNNSAVSLRLGKTNTIAVIVPDISNPHIAYQIKLIEDKLRNLNYSVIILNTNEDDSLEYKAITTALSKQVDGVLLCPCQQSSNGVEFLKKIEMPYALIGRYFSQIDTDYICADDVKGGYLAGKYLIEKGCKNPLYVGSYKYIEVGNNRFEGLKKAYEEAGIIIDEEKYIPISPVSENINELTEDIVKKYNFDSIVAFSDIIAFEIMPVINKVKKVPVVGFDAISSHLYLPFCYASVGMVNKGWADKATEVLLEKINGEKRVFHELIDVKMFEFNR